MLASLLVILLLLAAAALLAGKVRSGGWTRRTNHPIRIVACRPLGWQSSLLIVEAGGQQFLVGSSRAGLTGLGPLGAGNAIPPGVLPPQGP